MLRLWVLLLVCVGCYERGTEYTPIRPVMRDCDLQEPVALSACDLFEGHPPSRAWCEIDDLGNTHIACEYASPDAGAPATQRDYDPCLTNTECSSGRACTDLGLRWGLACRPPCSVNADCPLPRGDGFASCRMGRCILGCSDRVPCPSTLVCADQDSTTRVGACAVR